VEFLSKASNIRNYIAVDFLRKISDLEKLYAKFYKVFSKKKHNCGLADCVKVYQLVLNMKNFLNFIKN